MPAISIKAHFDGKSIQLDEPYNLPQDAQLLVTVLASETSDDERAAWIALASEGLARASGDSEPEYSDADIVP